MDDITKIPTSELEKDLADSYDDLVVCERALSMGIDSYSGESVEHRIRGNKHFIKVITAELARRNADN